jgi:hypothetical protein
VHDLGSGNEEPSQETGACVDAVKNPLRHAANEANTLAFAKGATNEQSAASRYA